MQVRAGNGLIPKCVKRTQILSKEWSWFFPSSFFHPRLEWTSQLSPLLGVGEVDKLNVKLRSLNVSGLRIFTKKTPNLSGSNYQQVKIFIASFPRNECLYEHWLQVWTDWSWVTSSSSQVRSFRLNKLKCNLPSFSPPLGLGLRCALD